MNITNESSLARLFLESFTRLNEEERAVLIVAVKLEQTPMFVTTTTGSLISDKTKSQGHGTINLTPCGLQTTKKKAPQEA